MVKNIWICIEKADGNYSAFAPEVPGCITTGDTVEETRANMIEALQVHMEGMADDGESLEGITGNFPEDDAKEFHDGLWTKVHVELAGVGDKVGV